MRRKYGLDIVGIDGSPCAINLAIKRDKTLPVFKHDIRQTLPFEESSFSAVICHQVIEHLTHDSAIMLLNECYRVLRPEGTLLLYSPSC